MSAWACIGAQCVFIGFRGLPSQPEARGYPDPQIGVVYTINWTGHVGHQFCIGLAGLHDDSCFDVRCFKPVSPAKTQAEDAAYIKSLLTKSREVEHS